MGDIFDEGHNNTAGKLDQSSENYFNDLDLAQTSPYSASPNTTSSNQTSSNPTQSNSTSQIPSLIKLFFDLFIQLIK